MRRPQRHRIGLRAASCGVADIGFSGLAGVCIARLHISYPSFASGAARGLDWELGERICEEVDCGMRPWRSHIDCVGVGNRDARFHTCICVALFAVGCRARGKAVVRMWYVIQVLKGREDAMAELIGRVVPGNVLDECFNPKYATETKVRGVWTPVERSLFPGYIVAVSDDPVALEQKLLRLEEFARVLRQGDAFVPLSGEEIELIGAFTARGERVVPLSRGYKAGDRVVVTEGPLVGHEYLIKSVNRHKSVAVLEVDLCGRPQRTLVGLAVLAEPGAPAAKRAELYVSEARRSA